MSLIFDEHAWTVGASKLLPFVNSKIPVDFVDLDTVADFHQIVDLFSKSDPRRLLDISHGSDSAEKEENCHQRSVAALHLE